MLHLIQLKEMLELAFNQVEAEPSCAFDTTCFIHGERRDRDYFLIEISIEENVLSIHDIVVTTEGCGLGSRIMQIIRAYASVNGLRLVNKDTLPSHVGFWIKNGFVTTPDPQSTYIEE